MKEERKKQWASVCVFVFGACLRSLIQLRKIEALEKFNDLCSQDFPIFFVQPRHDHK